jgi:multidrug resistance efflux pump
MLRIWVALWLMLAALALAGCGGGAGPAASAANAQPQSTDVLPEVRADTSVIAEGKVIPAQDAVLAFSTGGVVAEVLVQEGDTVQPDQPLVRLKGSERLEAAVSAAELELLSAEQALSDLRDSADLARSNAMLELANAKRELDKAEKRTQSKEYKRGDQEQVDTARANYILAEDAVKEAEKQYDRVDDRADDDPVRAASLSQLAAARQTRDQALYNLNYLLARPSELDVNEIDAKLALAQARVAEAERQLTLLKDGPDANKQALAEARVENARKSVAAAQAGVDDLVLNAPFGATVTTVNITAGETATPGAPVISLADTSNWYVETTDLTELNIARVKMGQPAMVRFDAVPGLDIIGRVTNIQAFGENRQGDVVYTVKLKLEAPDERLRWNMTASVTFLEKEAQ